MKFQKTLLAATLAVVGFSAQANVVAAQEAAGAIEANVTKYQVDGAEYLKIDEIVSGQAGKLQAGQWYSLKDGELTLVDKEVTGGTVVAAGMVKYEGKKDGTSSTTVETNQSSAASNVDQNNYWSASTQNTVSTTAGKEESFTLSGVLVNATENGNTEETHQELVFNYAGLDVGADQVVETLAKKDIQIGNLTEDYTDTNGLAKYNFDIQGLPSPTNPNTTTEQVHGTLATIQTAGNTNTSVAAVTGNGLAVLDVPEGGLVNLEKGTVSFTTTTGETVTEKNFALTSYKDAAGNDVVRIGTGETAQYYLATQAGEKTSTLTQYEGDVTSLEQTGYGLADKNTGGQKITATNTGLVSNQNVTYGESVTTEDNLGKFKVSSATPESPIELSGAEYNIDSSASKTTTSKNVVTGIIAVDQETGEKTYGVQATNVVDNKVTGQTTLTANGIETTGDITFVDAATGDKTSVKGYLEETSKAVDAKVDAALVEVDSRLTQFNTTANRLNQRIDDVEETAYRGVAIALAAQQQIPNIGAGQFAVFGGVGHYEGESAAALGLASVLADGRTSFSAALGAAGNGEVGGRVGMAYVFGGK